MADAAGAPRQKRRQRFRQLLRQHQSPGALRPQQPLVPRERHRVQPHGLHVNVQHAGGLGAVRKEFQPVGFAERPHSRQRQHRAADVAGVGHHHGAGVGAQTSFQRVQTQCAGFITGHPGEVRPHLHQRPHDGVVLHSGDQNVVAGAHKAF